ncbi:MULTISPECIES: hypothetical protein [unclassified Vibrio]|uniref:Uncharacterized protein n=1 Tax=Vibrio sp. HB236076 TaxID=3232307 RepID=A0AB39HB51_9VIBR|nr:hypothetical protein [Vibrio sp. HB161653]MDP5253353.1 hypothetical protein [Vibrio sp. HB161653]
MPDYWNANEEGLLFSSLNHGQLALKSLQRCHLSHSHPQAKIAIKKLHEANLLVERVLRDPFNKQGKQNDF